MITKKKQSVETNPTERSLFAYKIFGSHRNIAIFVIVKDTTFSLLIMLMITNKYAS